LSHDYRAQNVADLRATFVSSGPAMQNGAQVLDQFSFARIVLLAGKFA
jgi:hypothetical protein